MANPTVSAKYNWFGISFLLSTICCLILILCNKIRIKLSIIDYLLAIFCLWGIILTYYIQKNLSFNLYVLSLVFGFYVLCRITIKQYKHYTSLFLMVLLITGLLEAVWGLGQLYDFYPSQHDLFKTTGSFYNSGPYAGYLSLILPIALYYLLFDYSLIKRKGVQNKMMLNIRWIISLLTFILIISILPATMSRASWVSALCGCLFILFIYISKNNKSLYFFRFLQYRKNKILSISIGLLVFLICVFGIYCIKKDSADGRIFIWKNSIAVILNSPFGVGIGHFPGAYGNAQISYFTNHEASVQEKNVAGSPKHAFNEYIQIAVEFGIIPFLLFILIIIFTLYMGYKYKNYSALAGFITLLVFATMSYPFSLLPFLISFVILIVLCINDHKIQKRNNSSTLYYVSVILGVFLIIGTSLYRYHALENAYKTWNKIKLFNNLTIESRQAVEYENLYPLLRHESSYLFEYAQCLNKLKRNKDSNELLKEMAYISCDPMIYNVIGRNHQTMNNYKEAEDAFKTASFLIPNRLYPHYLFTLLYNKTGDLKKTLEAAKTILSQKAKIHSKAVDEMKEEVLEIYNQHQSK